MVGYGQLQLAAATSSHPASKNSTPKTFEVVAAESAKREQKPVRPFVLYSLHHTFLTRLGDSGCDVWTLARIAGHSSITVSMRYVHSSEDAALDAMARLGGPRTSPSETSVATKPAPRLLTQ
jgi:integrase